MNPYHKIQSIYKRDPENNYKTFLDGEWSLPEFGYLAENMWFLTEKVDGTNIRIVWNHIDKTVTFNGKSDRAQLPGRLQIRLQEMVDGFLRDRFALVYPHVSVCCYGEGYGAGIQKGGDYGPDQDFVLFDIKIGSKYWLNFRDVEKRGEELGLDVVPLRGIGTLYSALDQVRQGFDSWWGCSKDDARFQAEGLVCRPCTELRTVHGDRVITKIKCKDFPDV